MAYSPDEAALALGISRDLVDELVRAGRLHSVKAGHRRLIGIRQIEEFLAGGSANPTAAST
jgi:excisionase family DNA binding protein